MRLEGLVREVKLGLFDEANWLPPGENERHPGAHGPHVDWTHMKGTAPSGKTWTEIRAPIIAATKLAQAAAVRLAGIVNGQVEKMYAIVPKDQTEYGVGGDPIAVSAAATAKAHRQTQSVPECLGKGGPISSEGVTP